MVELNWQIIVLAPILVATASCSKESRTLASDQPQTPPMGAHDPRNPEYADNVYQVSQGSRYFTWYGCGACHGVHAVGAANLSDGHWQHGNTLNAVYGFIAGGHPVNYGAKIPVEQLWQISAYVLDRANVDPAKSRRADMDQRGEPQGDNWTGPVG